MHAELTAPADYCYFTVRDAENYAAVGAEAALTAAWQSVAASTGYEIFVVCAQDLLPVHITLADSPPVPHPEWTLVADLPLHISTGALRVGGATVNAIGTTTDTGTGDHLVDLFYRGRAAALEQRRQLFERTSNASISWADIAPLGGIEAYHLYLRPVGRRRISPSGGGDAVGAA